VTTRVIHLPVVDKTITLAAYLHAIRVAKANPDVTFKHGLTCWWPCTGREIVGQFFEGVQDRINAGIPANMRGIES
jgi:hypothetical protein